MSQNEKLAFSDAFYTYKDFTLLRNEEDQQWRKLSLLDSPDLLEAQDWSSLRAAWGDLVGLSKRMASITAEVRGHSSLGQRPQGDPDVEVALQDAFCAPLVN
jgi:hypothetical protein